MNRLRVRVVDGVFMLALGCVAVLAPIGAYVNLKRTQERDFADIRRLRQVLDSTRAALTQAATASDSVPLMAEIRSREWYLARREYHLPFRATRQSKWWRPTGAPTLLVAAGVVCILGAIVVLRRRLGAT